MNKLRIIHQSRYLINLYIKQEFSSLSTITINDKNNEKKYWRQNNYKSNEESSSRKFKKSTKIAAPLLSMSLLVTIKDLFGIEKIKLDDDPLKDKIKQSWLNRKHRKYDDAINILHEAIPEAQDRTDPLILTRIIDELANTYYEKGDLENADKCFRDVIQRLVTLHGKNDSSPEFIGISLKMADIFARKGELDNAETGFKHCVTKQLQVMEQHVKKYVLAKGASVEERHLVEAHGPEYSDPIALFGMALELFAHFLIEYRDEDRIKEAEEYMDEVLKISTHIYGTNAFHSMNIINNFGAVCILKNRFELAKKYLEIGLDRIIHINECSGLLVGYYCNYAEALFHTGNVEKALEYAKKAALFAKDEDAKIQKYAANFLKHIERDARQMGKSGGGWFSWII